MSDVWRLIAERRIQEAIARGELDELPLAGRPISNDMAGVPAEQRLAFRVLKNAGVVPEEVQLMQQRRELRDQLRRASSPERRTQLVRELNAVESQYNFLMERRFLRL